MVRRLLRFASVITLLLGLTVSCSEIPEVESSFRFAFMTDIHVQPELDAARGYETAIMRINELQPDFVITGGDLIMDALEQSFERSKSLYDLFLASSENLMMPMYHTMGNHEVFGLYEDSGVDPTHPEYGKEMYLNRMSYEHPYYSFDHKGWHFIILDTIGFTEARGYYGHIDEDQLAWLRADLSQVEVDTPVALSVHIPLLSVFAQVREGATAPLGAGAAVHNSKAVLDLFADHNLRLVLQGHLHIVEEIVYRGTHFITGGAVCGNWWEGQRMGFEEGFVVVDITGDDLQWHYEDYGWKAN